MLRTTRIIAFVLLCTLLSKVSEAQMPQKNLVYLDFSTGFVSGDSLYNYDPTLPVSATNPWINTIPLPPNNVGLAVSPVLGSGDSTLTYYTGVDGNYWYYDPTTHVWVNTGHLYGTSTSVNFGGGGGYLYSLDGFGGFVFRFDGDSDAVWVATVNTPFPFDLVADCEGNFYVITDEGPFNDMDEYDHNGTFLQQWTVINPNGWLGSGGMANIGNNVYTDIEFQPNLTHATVTGGNLVFDSMTAGLPLMLATDYSVGDMASYGGPPLSEILPTITIAASATSVCQGDSVAFTSSVANEGPDPRYQWFINGVPVSGATDSTFTYAPHDSDVVSVQLVTDGGCSNVTSISPGIALNTFATIATLSYSANSFCSNATNILPLSMSPAGGLYASAVGLSIDSNSGAIDAAASLPGSYIVTYAAQQGNCQATATDTLNIEPMPFIKLSASATNICDGDTIQVAVQNDSMARVTWLPGPYLAISYNNNSAMLSVQQSGYIIVKATNDYCTSQDSLNITAHSCCNMVLPDAFTPNRDGRNDVFGPISNGYHTIQLFIIKNRWGQTVFQSSGNNTYWDGTINGEAAEMGTYFYYISYSCNNSPLQMELKGDVTLIR